MALHFCRASPCWTRTVTGPKVPINNQEAIHAKGGRQRIAQRSAWGRDAEGTRAALNAWNTSIAAVRCRIEKVFGTWKRSYGLAHMRFIGLAKASLLIHFTAIAYNLRRTWRILAPQTA